MQRWYISTDTRRGDIGNKAVALNRTTWTAAAITSNTPLMPEAIRVAALRIQTLPDVIDITVSLGLGIPEFIAIKFAETDLPPTNPSMQTIKRVVARLPYRPGGVLPETSEILG